MSATEDYRHKAASCHLVAEGLANPANRVPMLELADAFLRMAGRMERLKQVTVLATSLDPNSPRNRHDD
jgi:hypothetical protein